jgi:hypothetical protein
MYHKWDRSAYWVLVGKLKERDLDVDGRILTWIVEK